MHEKKSCRCNSLTCSYQQNRNTFFNLAVMRKYEEINFSIQFFLLFGEMGIIFCVINLTIVD